ERLQVDEALDAFQPSRVLRLVVVFAGSVITRAAGGPGWSDTRSGTPVQVDVEVLTSTRSKQSTRRPAPAGASLPLVGPAPATLFSFQVSGAGPGERDHLVDRGASQRNHQQAVEAQGDAGALGQAV